MNVVFPCCANWETSAADTKCFWTKSETFFVSATNVARAGKRENICVGNNVSSFARALRPRSRCALYMLTQCSKQNHGVLNSFGIKKPYWGPSKSAIISVA